MPGSVSRVVEVMDEREREAARLSKWRRKCAQPLLFASEADVTCGISPVGESVAEIMRSTPSPWLMKR